MAKVIDQSIPAGILDSYTKLLLQAKTDGHINGTVEKRPPFEQPTWRGIYVHSPTPLQAIQRKHFLNSTICFNCQKDTGGAVPPAWGPRNKSWWYNNTPPEECDYFRYFMKESINKYLTGFLPEWCWKDTGNIDTYIWNISPDTNFSHELLVGLFGGHPYGYMQAIFLCPKNKFLHLYCYSGTDYFPEKIEIREIDPDSFQIEEVTWNTAPEIGKLVGMTHFPRFSWSKIPTGSSGAILIRTILTTGTRYFRSSLYEDKSFRPYFTKY